MKSSIHIALLGLSAVSLAPTLDAQGVLYHWQLEPGGAVMVRAGDVDGDGLADYALGQVQEARVRVFSGLDGTEIRSIDGALANDGFGTSVASLEDANGDGRADLVVGTSGPVGLGGRGYVRGISGLNGQVLWHRSAPQGFDRFGSSMAVTSDTDGDGVPEVLVGVGSGAKVFVLSGASGLRLFDVDAPPGSGAEFGQALGAAGDINGDGTADFLVGDRSAPPALSGRVTAYSGVDGSVLLSVLGPVQGGGFGSSLSLIDDANGDGTPDFLVGSPSEILSSVQVGRVRLVSGADGSFLLQLEGGLTSFSYGNQVGAYPDLDGDGRRDLLISTGSYHVGCCTFFNGDVRIHSSVTGGLLFEGIGHSSRISVVPDVDGNGLADYLVSTFNVNSELSSALVLVGVEPPTQSLLCAAKQTSLGCDPWILADGAPSLSTGPDFTVTCRRTTPNSTGMILWSLNEAMTPLGGGSLCLASPIRRTPVQSTGNQGDGCTLGGQSGSLEYTFTKPFLSGMGIGPGSAFYVQGWFRDSGFASPDDIGLTSSMRVVLWP